MGRPPGVVFLREVSQVVIIMEVEMRDQLLVDGTVIYRPKSKEGCVKIKAGVIDHLTEVDAAHTVSNPIQWWRPAHHAHDVGDHQQNSPRDPRFSRQAHLRRREEHVCQTCARHWEPQIIRETHMEGELAGEVVHAAGIHEAQGVSHSLGAQDALACDWTDAPVGQGGGHDAPSLTGHLDGTQLEKENLMFLFSIF